ncbi:extracellular serine-rich protein [Cordyceps fumosorosea ARSEF 2679]|uniref:Extracellular serine-rich protein n=1 Tax=Cordyceps fumosorosea (strain ARSEF 2679) TaxID=1081104 RepID=A0A162I7F6_CORFA|nr:extracellular serine-rich protein [Cordyceps fumosorosea ARSEF 2679]OAA53325.1 extracellular serine-rich protein [Cordyceps fumosorosea ARSEF 2679]
MHFNNALLLAGAAAVAHAKTVCVTVGADGGVTFGPGNSNAIAGDIVEFRFFKTHSIVQAAFDKPCEPLPGGFASGFVKVEEKDCGLSTFSVTVKDDKPIWFYSGQGDACKKGMVGSINAPATGNTLPAFCEGAKASNKTVNPTKVPCGGILDIKQGVTIGTTPVVGQPITSGQPSIPGRPTTSVVPGQPQPTTSGVPGRPTTSGVAGQPSSSVSGRPSSVVPGQPSSSVSGRPSTSVAPGQPQPTTSGVPVRPTSVAPGQSSSLSGRPSSVAPGQPSSVSGRPSSVVSGVPGRPTTTGVAGQPTSVRPSSVSGRPSSVSGRPSSVSGRPTGTSTRPGVPVVTNGAAQLGAGALAAVAAIAML